jgi:hypothetical protein
MQHGRSSFEAPIAMHLHRNARTSGRRVESRELPMDLIADHISHRFGELAVLDDVSFTVRAG